MPSPSFGLLGVMGAHDYGRDTASRRDGQPVESEAVWMELWTLWERVVIGKLALGTDVILFEAALRVGIISVAMS